VTSVWNPRRHQWGKIFPTQFLVYHSGFKGLEDALPSRRTNSKKPAISPGFRYLQLEKEEPPSEQYIYGNGSTFAMMVSSSPLLAAYVVG